MDSKPTNASYNLVDEPWIAAAYADGASRNVSLSTLFRDAPSIRSIAGEMPQMYFATVRLALAVLYRAYDFSGLTRSEVIAEWNSVWNRGSFDLEIVEGYLSDCRDGFDLLSPERPFYQTAGLEYADKECDPVGALVPDVPKLDKFLFSMRSPQSVNELALDEAARYVVLAQAYDTAGIKAPVKGNTHVNKGKVYAPKGAVGTGWCGAIGGIFLEGRNLFQTLMLNWVLWDGVRSNGLLADNENDLPPWERSSTNPDLCETSPVGPVEALTWQSRRLRLVLGKSGREASGVILCYGDITTAVDKQYCETMTAWRESPAQQKRLGIARVPWMPVQSDASKALWRGLAPLLSRAMGVEGNRVDLRPGVIQWVEELLDEEIIAPKYAFSIKSQGMTYGTQSSVFEDAVDDKIDLHALMARNDSAAVASVLEVVRQADEAVGEIVKFVKNMERAAGDKRRSDQFNDDVRERAYDALDQLFRDRIARLASEDDLLDYCNEWRSEIHSILWRVARSYVDDAGRSMFAECDDMTSGLALHFLRSGLSRILHSGPRRSESPDEAEG